MMACCVHIPDISLLHQQQKKQTPRIDILTEILNLEKSDVIWKNLP